MNGDDEERRAGGSRIACGGKRGEPLRNRCFRLGDSDGGTRDVGQKLLDRDALRAAVLKKSRAAGRPRDISADDQHRYALEVRRDDARHHVRRPGPRRDDDRRRSTRRAVVVRRRERGGRFVARFDQASALHAKNCVEHGRYGPSGNAEERIDTGFDERSNQLMRR
jgi:hypothetical protein